MRGQAHSVKNHFLRLLRFKWRKRQRQALLNARIPVVKTGIVSATPLPPKRIPHTVQALFWERRQWILAVFALMVGVLVWRAVYLQVMHKEFLQSQGDARHLRTVPIIAHRGLLMDRNGEPLAVSTPVDSIWVNPTLFVTAQAHWEALTKLLNLSVDELNDLLAGRMQREFVYIKRHISPALAHQVLELNLPGVFSQREYRRYYPSGEVTAHLLGFTNIDDQGQEGLELALDAQLAGTSGAKRVIQGKNGQVIADIDSIKVPRPGQDIRLTINLRLQYLAYRELKETIQTHHAKAGSVVILDVHTGEVLALVNQPGFNPNNRDDRDSNHYRNRAVTDVFEPGSTLKPFTIITALQSGQYKVGTRVNTHPGTLQLGKYTVRDARDFGTIDLATIIQKSSNVGASKIALSLPAEKLWKTLTQVGFNQVTGSGFPGEVGGHLSNFNEWRTSEQATLSFGYGLNVTLLQLARAYAVLGNQGVLPPVQLVLPFSGELRKNTEKAAVISAPIAQQVLNMLETVVQPGGTGSSAQIKGYRVAGKTGTVRKSIAGGYSDDYLALFAGLVPASKPRLVMVIVIDQPRGSYYGGEVAAPLFAKVMEGALRLMNVPPDEI